MSPGTKKPLTAEHAKDTGLALLLIGLIVLYFFYDVKEVFWPGILLIVIMAAPKVFALPAKGWFAFSHLLGTVMTKVLLSLLFAIVVLPVALIRRAMGADAMKLKPWKSGDDSVFQVRDHTFKPTDLETPY